MEDSSFLKAYRDFEADKFEARRLQGEITLLRNGTAQLLESLEQRIADADSALEVAREDARFRKGQHERAIVAAESDYARARKRVAAKSEGLSELLHAEMRNQ